MLTVHVNVRYVIVYCGQVIAPHTLFFFFFFIILRLVFFLFFLQIMHYVQYYIIIQYTKQTTFSLALNKWLIHL